MGTTSFEPVTDAHLAELARNMRPEDAAECRAGLALGPLEALVFSVARSELSGALLVDTEVLAIYGVGSARRATVLGSPELGVAWVLTSHAVYRHPKAFFRASRRLIPQLLELYPVLINLVDARYAAALRWVRRLGFEVLPTVAYGPEHRPFHPIRLRRQPWDSCSTPSTR